MKYSEDCIKKLEEFTQKLNAESPQNFWKHCSVHHIACLLDVSRETIYAWEKKYPEFSDTIKRWKAKRNATFLELRNKNASWIFLAKNWLEMTDRQELEHKGDFEPIQVIMSNGAKGSQK